MRDRERPSRGIPEASRGIKSIVCRVTLAEHASLLKLLADDDMSVQRFLRSCVMAYVRGDKPMQKLVSIMKTQAHVDPREQAGHVLSMDDRRAILDEIEDV